MRLFIAAELDENAREAFASMQTQLRRAGVGGNYTKRENLHITLAFIGEYGDSEKILRLLSSLETPPMTITPEGFGAFDGLWWAGIEKNAALENYVRRLRRALAENGVPFDKKRFSPHVTLIRRPDRAAMPALSVPQGIVSPVTVSLMRSDRGKYGMIYTRIE